MSTNSTTTHTDHGHAGHHITPVSKLFTTFMFLMALMIATIAWYYFAATLPNSPLMSYVNNIIAITIAVIKAVTVIQIFMGVKYSSNLIKTYAILGFVWASLMTIMFIDYGSRRWEPVKGWTPESPLAMPRDHEPAELGMPPRSEIKIESKGH